SPAADTRSCYSNNVKAPGLRLTPPPVHSSSRFFSQPSLRSGKVLASVQGSSKTDESLVVCFGEMLIDFVPTINGLALAESPAFKKHPVVHLRMLLWALLA
ncbi:hypothetical protein Tco_0094590, partial [Tanacetum coccineum]